MQPRRTELSVNALCRWPAHGWYDYHVLEPSGLMYMCSLSAAISWHDQIPLTNPLKFPGENENVFGDTWEFTSLRCFRLFPEGILLVSGLYGSSTAPLCTHSQGSGGLKNLDRIPSLWLHEPNVSDGVIYSVSRRLCVASAKPFNFTHLLNIYLLLHRGLRGLI